jgi:hypothetical protein
MSARSVAPMSLGLRVLVACLAAWGVSVSGCAPATAPKPSAGKATAGSQTGHHGHDDHASHAHPESLGEGLVELERVVGEVAEHLAAGATDAADTAVHAVGHLLEDLEGLLAREKDKLGAAGAEAVGKALSELSECFDKLDVAMHAGAEAAETPAAVHASVAERVKAAVDAIRKAL